MSGLQILALVILGLAAFDASPAAAQRVYPWCTRDNTTWGTMSCLYSTRAQCMESASGNGQTCVQNPEYWWKIWYPDSKYKSRR